MAILLSCFAAIAFYLGCPNQQWLAQRRYTFFTGLLVSLLLAALAVLLFSLPFSLLSAVFSVLTVIMLALGMLPILSPQAAPASTGQKVSSGLVKSKQGLTYRPRWLLRPVLATVFGFPLAVGLSGLIVVLSPGPLTDNVKAQFAMWLITPLWLLPLCLMFFSHRLWPWVAAFSVLNGVIFGLLLWLQPSDMGAV